MKIGIIPIYLLLLCTSLHSIAYSQEVEEVSFQSQDGLEVSADFYKVSQTAPTILMFHQSVSSRGEYKTIAPKLQETGFNCLAVDLRWGKKDFWNKIPNKTAERNGTYPIIDHYEDTETYQVEKVWPIIFDAYQDMEASLQYLSERGYNESKLVMGSSFSAMLAFKLAQQYKEVAAVLAFSPGEYHPTRDSLLASWAKDVSIPVYLSAGGSKDELDMVEQVASTLSKSVDKKLHQSKGRHGASVLIDHKEDWPPLLNFVERFAENQHLHNAKKVANWLKVRKIESPHGKMWVDEIGKEKISLSLSSGVAGKVLFYLELYQSTGNKEHLHEASLGCQYLLSNLPQTLEQAQAIRNGSSLYGTISGSAFVLMEAYKITKNEDWKNKVQDCLKLLDELSQQADGRYWNNFNDVLVGGAGTGLFLLYLYEELGNPIALKMAQEAAELLEQRAIQNKDSLYWHFNQEAAINLPNFSHGAAGIAYFFARLYEHTQTTHYLEMAKAIAQYLELIAWKPEDSFLIPYGFPDYDWEREYDIGWAHGPAGTARFFYKLWQITQEKKWLDLVEACAKGIELSGLPNNPKEHFGASPFPIDMRFGLGSVIDFYIHLEKLKVLQNKDEYLRQLVKTLNDKALQPTPSQRHWNIARYGFMGGTKNEPATFTGYFYGAAGLGRLYIKLYRLKHNLDMGITLPDNPFMG